MNQLQVSEKISTIIDPITNKDIVVSGTLSGISVYDYKIQVVLEVEKKDRFKYKKLEKEIEAQLKELNAKTKVSFLYVRKNNANNQIKDVLKMTEIKKSKMPTNQVLSDKWNMDGHKLFWHMDRVEEWARGDKIAPLHIDMGISSGCNMGCTFCYGVIQNRAGFGTNQKLIKHIPLEAVKRTFSDAKEMGVRSIALIGEGENTLHPNFHEILDHAKSIDLDISIATNGIRIDEKNMENYVRCLKWLRINISASNPESFFKVHRVKQFHRVINNAKKLIKFKKTKKYDCTIGFQMVVNKDNVDDIVPLAKLAKECEVDYFVVKPCSDTYDGKLSQLKNQAGTLGSKYNFIHGLFQQAESHATKNYAVNIKWMKALNGGWKDYESCHGTQFILAISGTGNVFPCGHWFNERKEEFLMGNVIEKTLKEIWQSERYDEVQKKIRDEVDVNNDCEANCRHHYVNRYLSHEGKTDISKIKEKYSKLIKNKPNHINFI